jgi:hypothetical protein
MNSGEGRSKTMIVHGASMCTAKLDLFFNDSALGSATGFFYRYGQTVALVTNWHVLSGIHPLTGQTRHSLGGRPNRVELHVNIRDKSDGHTFVRPESWQICSNTQSHWWKHRGYSYKAGPPSIVDIGVMFLEEHLRDYEEVNESIVALPATVIANFDGKEPKSLDYGDPQISSEMFILGYPRGLTRQGILPIWKRGTVAYEPLIPVLVEADSRGGGDSRIG